MDKVINVILWSVLSILLFALFYVLHKKFKFDSVIERVRGRYKEKKEQKLFDEAQFIATYGTIENTSFYYKLDRLMLTSGIKRFLPFLNGEVFAFMEAAIFLLGIVIGMTVVENVLFAVFLGALLVVVIYVTVLAMWAKTYNSIEDGTAIFVSLLSNHAKGNSDIMTIMQNTYTSLDGPIRSLVSKFIYDAERSGNLDIAFDYMKESVDNRQFATIVMNLKNCMHYQANYEEVLAQMMGQITATLTAREERKNVLYSMKVTLVSISIASIVIVNIIGKGLGINVVDILTGNMLGQLLLFVTGILYLFVVVKLFVTDR